MKTLKIGVLSDTHLSRPDDQFRKTAARYFSDISIIFHAGDLTDISVLDVFQGKEVHAVHGNMCGLSSHTALPKSKIVKIGPYQIALTHGMQFSMKGGNSIEDQLLLEFSEADCIIYGHTHIPVCHKIGQILLMNPGSFMPTGRFGAPGTYGILELGNNLTGKIYEAVM